MRSNIYNFFVLLLFGEVVWFAFYANAFAGYIALTAMATFFMAKAGWGKTR